MYTHENGQLSFLAPQEGAPPKQKAKPRDGDELIAVPYFHLDLTPGHGDLFGDARWEFRSPYQADGTVLNTGIAPREPVYTTLSTILERAPDPKYYLSHRACLGILRRAEERGKQLPETLEQALKAQAGLIPSRSIAVAVKAYHINQRDEGIDLHGVSGALMAGAPARAQRSGSCGERRSSGMSEPCRLRRGEGYGACDDAQMQTFVTGEPTAFAVNQRDEVRDLRDIAGALGAQPGMKQQTFIREGCLTSWDTQQQRIFAPEGVSPTLTGADGGGGRNPGGLLFAAGFCAGAGPSAGSVGYQDECAPTLKAAESGTNMVPSVLCLNDQGGRRMGCSEEVTGTLRAQEHGHQPVIFENHGIDSRYTGPHDVAPTLSARAGTGGNNLPLVTGDEEVICITGNAIDRQPQNGGNGLGYQQDIAYTLTATDHHAVFNRQWVDEFKESDTVSTESARQHKDATDLICQRAAAGPKLIRRLTPLECERLQGFPDGWTDIPGAADSARYKALGNSVAIPCVSFLLRGIVLAHTSGL